MISVTSQSAEMVTDDALAEALADAWVARAESDPALRRLALRAAGLRKEPADMTQEELAGEWQTDRNGLNRLYRLALRNPFDDRTAMVMDAKGVYQGELAKSKSVMPIDPQAFGRSVPFEQRPEIRSQALKEAAGEKHSRIADILEPDRINSREEVAQDLWHGHDIEFVSTRNGSGNQSVGPTRFFGELIIYSPGLRP